MEHYTIRVTSQSRNTTRLIGNNIIMGINDIFIEDEINLWT